MKAQIKTIKGKAPVSIKLGSKKLVVTNKKNTKSALAHAVKEKKERVSLVEQILTTATSMKIDTPTVWLGDGTKRPLFEALKKNALALKSAKLKKTDEFLVVLGKVAYAWKLLGTDGVVYERMHEKTPVRGSIALLKKEYGAAAVKLCSKEKAIEIVKKLKAETGAKIALGLA